MFVGGVGEEEFRDGVVGGANVEEVGDDAGDVETDAGVPVVLGSCLGGGMEMESGFCRVWRKRVVVVVDGGGSDG